MCFQNVMIKQGLYDKANDVGCVGFAAEWLGSGDVGG